jgi:hypothetical protein
LSMPGGGDKDDVDGASASIVPLSPQIPPIYEWQQQRRVKLFLGCDIGVWHVGRGCKWLLTAGYA